MHALSFSVPINDVQHNLTLQFGKGLADTIGFAIKAIPIPAAFIMRRSLAHPQLRWSDLVSMQCSLPSQQDLFLSDVTIHRELYLFKSSEACKRLATRSIP